MRHARQPIKVTVSPPPSLREILRSALVVVLWAPLGLIALLAVLWLLLSGDATQIGSVQQ